MPASVWIDIETSIEKYTNSIANLKVEISKFSGVMTRSKTLKLRTYQNKLDDHSNRLRWYKQTRQERLNQLKIIIEQLLDNGFVCPSIQFEPFEYSCDEFCNLLRLCTPIANDAWDIRMSGFRCTLFY